MVTDVCSDLCLGRRYEPGGSGRAETAERSVGVAILEK